MEPGNLVANADLGEYVQIALTVFSSLIVGAIAAHKYAAKKDTEDALEDKKLSDHEADISKLEEVTSSNKDRLTEVEATQRLLEERIKQNSNQSSALFKMVDKLGDKIEKTLDRLFKVNDK